MTDRRWMARAAKALAEVGGYLPGDLGLMPSASHHHERGSGAAVSHPLVEASLYEDAELTAILALIDSGEIQ